MKKNIYILLLIVIGYSCNSYYKTSFNDNRYISDIYYHYSNDSIQLAIDLFGDYTYGAKNEYNNIISVKKISKDKEIIKSYFPELRTNKKNFLFKASTDTPPYYHMRAYAFTAKSKCSNAFVMDSISKTLMYCINGKIYQYILLFDYDQKTKATSFDGLINESKQIVSTIREDENYYVSSLQSPFTIAQRGFEQDTANYLSSINTLKHVESNYSKENERWLYLQGALTYNAFIQNNREYTKLLSQYNFAEKTTTKVLYTDNDAFNFIKKQAENKQVVMINEQHWQSNHRFLGNLLLKYFYDQGFKYLAVEAIDGRDEAALNERKYPLQSSGFYTKDPQFGNLIRNALIMGFHVVAYDSICNNRELVQAQNIYNKTIAKEKDSKVLVWAGVAHIIEQQSNNSKMAYYFREISNIDPLTIEQTQGDRNANQLKNSYLGINADTILREKCDIFIYNNLKELNYKIDPQAKDVILLLNLSAEINDKLRQHGNLILSVFYKHEFEANRLNCIPILNRLITDNNDINISLPSENHYIAIIRSPVGSILEHYELNSFY